jgi:hypothetical protein
MRGVPAVHSFNAVMTDLCLLGVNVVWNGLNLDP